MPWLNEKRDRPECVLCVEKGLQILLIICIATILNRLNWFFFHRNFLLIRFLDILLLHLIVYCSVSRCWGIDWWEKKIQKYSKKKKSNKLIAARGTLIKLFLVNWLVSEQYNQSSGWVHWVFKANKLTYRKV